MTAAVTPRRPSGGPVGVHTGPRCGRGRGPDKPPCRATAGFGTDHVGRGYCKNHGGNTPAFRTKYARERVAEEVAKWQASNAFPGDVDATVQGPEVLLRALARQEATVLWIRRRIARWSLPLYADMADEPGGLLEGDRTGMFELVEVREAHDRRGDVAAITVSDSERAAWLKALFEWEQLVAKTAAKVSQLGIQEQAVRLMAAQAPNVETVLLGAARRLGLELEGDGVRAAVAAAIREDIGPTPQVASLHDVQSRAILSA